MSTPSPSLIIPMPVPGTPGAPHFDGKDVREYLDTIEAHALRAGITDKDKMVNYILNYASVKVHKNIRYLQEFDKDIEEGETDMRTWVKASAKLIALYRSLDESDDVTMVDLEKFLEKHSKTQEFRGKKDINEYTRHYYYYSSRLRKNNKLTDTDENWYYITGLPNNLIDWFVQQTPETKRSNKNPPTIDESIKILYAKFDKKSLSYCPWEDRRESNKHIRFEED
jgi:hypothetical protein